MTNTQRKLDNFERTLDVAERLFGDSVSAHGAVFKITPEHVVKIRSGFYPEERYERAVEEFETLDTLHKEGVWVPKPEGVFRVEFADREDRRVAFPGLVMEFIEGVPLSSLNRKSDEYKEGIVQYNEEVARATKMGYNLYDHKCGRNGLWVPSKREIRLIDFSGVRKVA